ncbi:hypothetical protein AN1V17_15820 [Vallitalea sediminicola]
MGVIVRDKVTHKKYVLLGTGFGAYKAVRPSFFGGNLIPHEEEGTIATIAVCDSKGDIIWINSNNLQVIEVDGVKIEEIALYNAINESNKELNKYEFCPGCGTKVDVNEKYCPGCGLTLTD